ncbi:DUF2322 family protein [Acidithiobacillus sp.]|uniref:DUF2322 family protein n=1 Tax=Acidithiobacillus sp. TaxID=1872118 RepID=UPI0025C4E5E6|nr:DUF2322 family protein [Acidithiobacillus sp.]
MPTLPDTQHIRKLHFYGGPTAAFQGEMENSAEQARSVQVLYHLALRHGVISPSAAREGLALLPEDRADAAAGRVLLQRVLEDGDFLAVRVVR